MSSDSYLAIEVANALAGQDCRWCHTTKRELFVMNDGSMICGDVELCWQDWQAAYKSVWPELEPPGQYFRDMRRLEIAGIS